MAHFNIPNRARLLLPFARELELTIACDIQHITSTSDLYRRDFVDYADILIFSASNFQYPGPLIADFLRADQVQIIVVGMEKRGYALGTKEGIEYFPAIDMTEPVVDSSGAGDSLAAGFLSSYALDGKSYSESIWRGKIAARHACSIRASQSPMMTREQLDGYNRDFLGPRSPVDLDTEKGS